MCERENLELGLHSYSSRQKQACCTSTLLIKVPFTNINDLKINNPFSPPRKSTHDQVLLKYLRIAERAGVLFSFPFCL